MIEGNAAGIASCPVCGCRTFYVGSSDTLNPFYICLSAKHLFTSRASMMQWPDEYLKKARQRRDNWSLDICTKCETVFS